MHNVAKTTEHWFRELSIMHAIPNKVILYSKSRTDIAHHDIATQVICRPMNCRGNSGKV